MKTIFRIDFCYCFVTTNNKLYVLDVYKRQGLDAT